MTVSFNVRLCLPETKSEDRSARQAKRSTDRPATPAGEASGLAKVALCTPSSVRDMVCKRTVTDLVIVTSHKPDYWLQFFAICGSVAARISCG